MVLEKYRAHYFENRYKFALEVTAAIIEAVGKEKVGIRISPYGVFGDMPVYDEVNETYSYLTKELEKPGILYVHIVDHSSMGTPEVPLQIKQEIKKQFNACCHFTTVVYLIKKNEKPCFLDRSQRFLSCKNVLGSPFEEGTTTVRCSVWFCRSHKSRKPTEIYDRSEE